MNMPERLTSCPRSPECTMRVIYRDSEGNLYRYDTHDNQFKPHRCSTVASEKPKMCYLAEWFNKESGRTRWVGPERMRKSAEKPPADEKYRRRGAGANPVWELKNIYVSELNWKLVEDE